MAIEKLCFYEICIMFCNINYDISSGSFDFNWSTVQNILKHIHMIENNVWKPRKSIFNDNGFLNYDLFNISKSVCKPEIQKLK